MVRAGEGAAHRLAKQRHVLQVKLSEELFDGGAHGRLLIGGARGNL